MKIPILGWQISFGKRNPNIIEVHKGKWEQLMKSVQLDGKYPNIRPTLDPYQAIGDEVLIPPTPLPIPTLFEIQEVSDTLRITTQALKREIFRHGGEILERFAFKCEKCDTEYSTEVDRCSECNHNKFSEPDKSQKKKLQQWLNRVNENDQSLLDMSEQVNDDIEIVDDAYMVAIKEYLWGPDNELYGERLIEVIRAHPQYIRIIADKTGRPGYNTQGKPVLFCLEHRNTVHQTGLFCPNCNRPMFRAHFRADKYEGGYIYYAKNEVHHESKYSPSLVYGKSPIISIWMKVVTLFNMDNYIKNYYSKQRPPRGLLFVRTSNMQSLEKAWSWMLDMFRKNPHQIPPITVEAPANGQGGGKFVEFIDFMRSLDEMQYIESRNEFRKTIGAVYGVMPIFQGDVESSGGLNNESQQISVTSKAVYYGQKVYNDGYFPWLLSHINITDYIFMLKPNESADDRSREELFTIKADNATKMQGMGFDVTLNEDKDFEFGPMDEPVEAPSPFGPEGGLGGPLPGTFPGPGAIPEELTEPVPQETEGGEGKEPEIPIQGEEDVGKGIELTGPRALKRAAVILSGMKIPFKIKEGIIELQDPEAHLSIVGYIFEEEGILFEAKPYGDTVEISLPEKAPEQNRVEKGTTTYNNYYLNHPDQAVGLVKNLLQDPKTFHIVRNQDESGTSGTGRVLNGVVFPDGTTVIRWDVDDKPNSTATYESFEAFKEIHIDAHPGNETEIHWHEGEVEKGIVRLAPEESAPPGIPVQVGPRGGRFYFTGAAPTPSQDPATAEAPAERVGPLQDLQSSFESAKVGIVEKLKGLFPEENVQSRLKSLNSINRKAELLGVEPEKLNDIAGTRVIVGDNAAVEAASEQIRKNFEILEEENFLEDPKGGYYSAIHLLVKQDSKTVEVQIKSENALKIQNIAHDFIYKAGPLSDEEFEIFKNYLTQSADHELGKRPEPPECPDVVRRLAACI